MIPTWPSSTGEFWRPRRSHAFGYIHYARVEELAKKKGVSMSQIALAWLMAKDPVAAPIVGTTKSENLTDLIGMPLPFTRIASLILRPGAVHVKLDADEMKYLEELYTPKAVVGY